MRIIFLAAVLLIQQEVKSMDIVTIFNDPRGCLAQQAEAIPLTTDGLHEAMEIAGQLKETLLPLMPAAGLAAPQIGISKQVFIYSWDRSIENLEVAINPTIEPVDGGSDVVIKESRWESCFSTIQSEGQSHAALVTRPTRILVSYTNLDGEIVKQKLEGFAAQVFQHEYDHLQGVENIRKEGAEIRTFSTKSELITFMQEVKKKDSVNYVKPMEKLVG